MADHSKNCGVEKGLDCGRFCWCLCHQQSSPGNDEDEQQPRRPSWVFAPK